MTLHGTIQNGIVVFDSPSDLPNGTPVTVVVEHLRSGSPANQTDLMTDEQLRRRKAALAELLALPNENPGDSFSGADHDEVLYGDLA